MKPARSLSAAERAILAAKLAQMQAAVDRKATTRRMHAMNIAAAREDITRVDGRYSHVSSIPSEGR